MFDNLFKGQYMKRILTILLLAASALLIYSCSEDSGTNNTSTGDMYMMKEGNYWVYNSDELDEEGQHVATSIDSVVVTRKTNKLNKDCFELKAYSDGVHEGNTYQYSEGTILYTLLESILPEDGLGLPFGNIEEQWVKIADMNSSQWVIFELDLKDAEIDYGGVEGKLSGKFKITGKKGHTVILDYVLGKKETAQEFITENSVIGKLSLAQLPGVTIDIDFKIVARSYFVAGIGMVRSVMEPTKIALNTPIGKYELPVSGSNDNLIRTNVKK